MENMKKSNEKKQEKGMNRTNPMANRLKISRKQRTPKREEKRVLLNKEALFS